MLFDKVSNNNKLCEIFREIKVQGVYIVSVTKRLVLGFYCSKVYVEKIE